MRRLQTRREQKPHRGRSVAAVLAALILSACLVIPDPHPPKISDQQLAPIEIGKTTRADVEAAFGKPAIDWDTERVWVYKAGPSADLVLILFTIGRAAAVAKLGDHLVIMRFDEEGRVDRLDRRTGPQKQRDYGDFLRAWLAEQSDKTGSGAK